MINLDQDVDLVLAFMERQIEMHKLVRVATTIASLAPVLWSDTGANEVPRLALFRPESNRGQQSIAKQLTPEQPCEHGGSVVAMDNP